jgi:glucose/arabinose dehydrogenase
MPRSAAALALVVAATLVGACGSDSSTQNADTNTNATASTNDDTGGSTPAEGRAAAGRGVRLVKVGDFQAPVYVTAPPGDRRRIFVVEQAGRIMIVRGGKPVAQPFLDIRSKVTAGGEQGFLSMAFAPDYAQSGLFYVYYTEKSGTESIWEYHRASDDSADPNSARLVMRMADPEPNHNGGLMIFGSDKLMYVGTGDGGGGNDQHGSRGNAQSLSSPLGKILRIDPRSSGGKPYTIPSSNPFVGRSGARGEIYAFGLRNPWRFSFDRANDDLVIGDVGQDEVEEIDFVKKGR